MLAIGGCATESVAETIKSHKERVGYVIILVSEMWIKQTNSGKKQTLGVTVKNGFTSLL
jgi:hypothetical protein